MAMEETSITNKFFNEDSAFGVLKRKYNNVRENSKKS